MCTSCEQHTGSHLEVSSYISMISISLNRRTIIPSPSKPPGYYSNIVFLEAIDKVSETNTGQQNRTTIERGRGVDTPDRSISNSMVKDAFIKKKKAPSAGMESE